MVFSELEAQLKIDISDYLSGLAQASAATRAFGESTDLDIDTDSAQAALEALQRELNETKQPARQAAQAIDEVGDESRDTSGETNVLRNALGRLTAPLARARASASRAASAVDSLGDETTGTTGAARTATSVVGRFVRRLRSTARSGRRAASAVDDVGDEITDTAGKVSVVSGSIRRLSRAFRSIIPSSNRAASGIDEVGDESLETAGEAGLLSGVLGGLKAALIATDGDAGRLARALDEVGDEASGSLIPLTLLAGALGTLGFADATEDVLDFVGALGKLSALLVGGGALLTSLAGLAGALAGVAGAATGVAGAFGLILGTGFLAYIKKYPKELKQVRKEIMKMLTVFGQQFIPLIRDGVRALDDLVAAMLAATGNLKPFVRALRDLGQVAFRVLPKIVDFFFTLGRKALPELRALGQWLMQNIPNAVRTLGKAFQRVEDELVDLLLALSDFIGELVHFGSIVATFVYPAITTVLNGLTELMQILRTPPPQTEKALRRLADALDTLGRKLQPVLRKLGPLIDELVRLAANIATVATKLLTKLIPAISDFISILTNALDNINDFIEEIFDLGKQAEDTASAFEELEKKVSGAVKGMASSITKQLPKIEKLGKTFEDVKKTVKQAIKTTDRIVETTAKAIKRHLLKPLDNAESEWSKTWESMEKEAGQSLDMILKAVSGYTSRIGGEFREFLKNLGDIWEANFSGKHGIVASARDAMITLWNIFKPALDKIQQAWDKWGDEILDIFEFVTDTILTILEIFFDAVLTNWNVSLDLLSGDWKEAWKAIEGFFERTLDRISGYADEWGSGLVSSLQSTWSDMVSDAQESWENFKDTVIGKLKDLLDYITTEFASDLKDALVQAAKNAGEAFAEWMQREIDQAIPDTITLPTPELPDVNLSIGSGGGLALPRFGDGGIVTEPTLGIIGEEGPEAVVPLDRLSTADGRPLPTGGDGDGGVGGEQEVTVTIDVRGDNAVAEAVRRGISESEQQRERAIDRSKSSFGGA